MKLIKHYLTENPCFTAGEKIQVKGIMLHSVGCSVSEANPFLRSWNKPDFYRACVHCFIDAITGIAYQTLPWTYKANHSGFGPNGSANSTHIGIEMCEPPYIQYISNSAFVSTNPEKSIIAAKRTSSLDLIMYIS